MSKLEDIYYELAETVDFFGLEIIGWDLFDEIEKDAHSDHRFFMFKGRNAFAYGEIINKKLSEKALLKRLQEIQGFAKRASIPYCYLAIEDKAFVCRAEETVNKVVFENDHKAFEKAINEHDNVGATSKLKIFKREYKKLVEKYKNILPDDTISRLSTISIKTKEIIITSDHIFFTESFENSIFKALLGEYKGEQVCRFMSSVGLHRMLTTKKVGMCSIVGMNDSTEVDYAFAYYLDKGHGKYPRIAHSSQKDDSTNYTYITSCSDESLKSDLTMWRLYGDDAKGVCIIYDIVKIDEDKFIFSPVSYARPDGSHPELDFVYDMSAMLVGDSKVEFMRFGIWNHFFKPKEYSVEKEVRLIVRGAPIQDARWVITSDGIYSPIIEFPIEYDKKEYPFVVNQIILGPKFVQRETNLYQIKELLGISNIGCNNYANPVVLSEINNYR